MRVKNKLSSVILYLSILLFIIGFKISDNGGGGWQQQFMPYLNNKLLQDITFTDSLTGYAVTGNNGTVVDTNYILKTTNGGDNWNIILTEFKNYSTIVFINPNTGYVCGRQTLGGYLTKTTNSGLNWYVVPGPVFGAKFDDMSVLNEDTIWVADKNSFDGGIFRTTNRGLTWRRQLESSSGLEKIYMYNKDIGFAGSSYIFKTTNSGDNWTIIPGQNGYNDIYFIDSMTGWKAYDSMRITTDGGNNWIRQHLPHGGILSSFYGLYNFVNVNRDTIWGSGGVINYPGNSKGFLFYTSNRGNNWQYQVPDTSLGLKYYQFINFVNNKNGWSYTPIINRGIHTNIGGDTTFYTGIQQLVSVIPGDYFLKQNYPNPFNPRTVISFSIKKNATVRITVYDIRGVEVQRLVEGRYNAGEYEVDFMGKFSSSGVYFYRMDAEDERSADKYSDTKRMILLK